MRKHLLPILSPVFVCLSAAVSVAQTGPAPDRAVAVVASAAQLPHAGENWLIAVGINRFEEERVNPLLFSKSDAEAVHAFFTRSGLVPPARTYLLTTGHADRRFRPTRLNILESVQYAADSATADSTILIFLAGHGFVDDEGKSYFLPEDGKLSLLHDSAVPIARLNEMLRKSRARRKALFVDACRNNPTRDGRGAETAKTERFLEALKSAAGQVTLAACGPGQASYEDASVGHGIFTAYLLKGLSGEARPDEAGIIDVTSLQKYLSRAVPEWSRQNRRPVQNPWMWGEMSVPIPLAVASRQEFVVPPSGGALVVPPLGGALVVPPSGGTLVVPPLGGASEKPPEGGTTSVSSGKSETAAWEALGKMEGLLSGASLDRQVTMLESFVKEWNGTSAANEAAKTLGQRKQEQERIAAEEARKRGQFQGWIEKARAAISARQWQTAESALKEAESIFPSDPAVKQTRSEYEKANPFRDFIADLGGGVKMEMVWIERGSGGQGGFWIGKYEVTNAQYRQFLRDSGYDGSRDADSDYLKHFKGGDSKNSSEDDYPMIWVSWNNAKAFCSWLSNKTGRQFSLPTVSQWTYACLAGGTGDYGFAGGESNLGEYAWFSGNSGGHTHPVGHNRTNRTNRGTPQSGYTILISRLLAPFCQAFSSGDRDQ